SEVPALQFLGLAQTQGEKARRHQDPDCVSRFHFPLRFLTRVKEERGAGRLSRMNLQVAIGAEGSAGLRRERLREDARTAVMRVMAGRALHLAGLQWDFARAIYEIRIGGCQYVRRTDPRLSVVREVHRVSVGQIGD